jgi:hypothetical protein
MHIHYDPYKMLGLVKRTHPADTVSTVAREFDTIFTGRPDLPDSMAPALRAMATELYLAGIEKFGHPIQIAAAGNGFRVFPRFDDGRLAQIVAAFEYVSRHPERCHA